MKIYSLPFARISLTVLVLMFCFQPRLSAASLGDVVATNWNKWSNGNDTVQKDDLLAAIARPEFKGENAAALVALETYMRKNKLDSIDKASAVAIQDGKTLERYQKDTDKLKGVNRVLFAQGQPDFNTMAQGPAGDCYFFSGTGWIAKYRSDVIRKAITQKPDKTYRVVFPNGDEATVTEPTDAEMAFNDSASTLSGGIWMPVLEKALGTILAGTNAKSAVIPDPTVAIDVPGVPIGSVVKCWTGNDAAVFKLADADRSELKKALAKMHDKTLMAEALMLKKNTSHLPWDHVYAVMDFDASAERLIIWNPLAYDFTPEGPDNIDNGYTTARGMFSIPLDDFMALYSYLAIEKN
jgi:hypothetical protein